MGKMGHWRKPDLGEVQILPWRQKYDEVINNYNDNPILGEIVCRSNLHTFKILSAAYQLNSA